MMECASAVGFSKNPAALWNMSRDMMSRGDPKPNPAHIALVDLEKAGKIKCIVTQNVDGLHQAAGSSNVVEYHGSTRDAFCVLCGKRVPITNDLLADGKPIPPRCQESACASNAKAILKPTAVLFGEPIPRVAMQTANSEVGKCDLLLVIGTSAEVAPASLLPSVAKSNKQKATVVEINVEMTSLTESTSSYLVQGKAGVVLSTVVKLFSTL